MSTDYGYINARVRGMKTNLLGDEFYSEALASSDFRAFLSVLGQSRYMHELEESQSRYEGLRAVDDALARDFFKTTRSLLAASDGNAGMLMELLLLRYDRENLKTIARAKHAGKSLEEIVGSLYPAGPLRPAVLEEVAAAPDMGSAAQALAVTKTPLKSAFSQAAGRYQSDGDLYALELSIDRAYYRVLLQRLRRVNAPMSFMRHLTREIDATNLRTAFKLRGAEESSEDAFVPGGREITRNVFDSIRSAEGSGGLQALSGTSFADVGEVESLAEAEQKVREVLDASARSAASDPLGPGVVVRYLRLKEAEIARLRLLARGSYYQVPRDALQRELGHA
ncbi:MAG TPA: V-type ATPase subunit [Trueperaceae bacterium]|nr:V-type ATPase subunit [Trueperaceae bacterium]